MKKRNKLQVLLLSFIMLSFFFTACSSSSSDTEEANEDVQEVVSDESVKQTGDANEETSGKEVQFAWSSEFDDWVLNGTEAKTITLIDLGDEDAGLSEIGQAQLNYIANVLESNESLNVLIKGHTDSDQKMGNGRGRAMWTKAKLIIGHDAVGSRISTEGVGTNEPLQGVDLADDSQKRVTVTFTK